MTGHFSCRQNGHILAESQIGSREVCVQEAAPERGIAELARYRPYLTAFDLTEAQKDDLLLALHGFVRSVLDQQFGHHLPEIPAFQVNDSIEITGETDSMGVK